MQISIMRDGLCLRGRVDKKEGEKCPAVILMHGFSGNMGCEDGNLFQTITDRLVEEGMAVVRFDFNGHGESDGDFSKMDVLNELEDAIAVLTYVRNLDFVTDIYVVGHSQGGVVAGLLAGSYPDVIRRLVLLAPAASLKTDAQKGTCMGTVYDTEHIPDVVNVGDARPVGGHYFRIAKWLPIYEVAGLYKGEALVICGGKDAVVDESAASRYGQAMENCMVERIEKLDHGLQGEEQRIMFQKMFDFLKFGFNGGKIH